MASNLLNEQYILSTAFHGTSGALKNILYDAAGNALIGQKTSANSIPVVLASDGGAINIGDVELVDNVGNSLINQTTMASSLPVAIASDQSTIGVKEIPAGTLMAGTISLAGTAEQITTSSVPCKYLHIYNHNGNDVVYWGSSTVTTNYPGIPADSGQTIEINDVSKVYFTGTASTNIGYAYISQ